MAYEALDWVWVPDENTPYNYTSNLATMASSIENKVGKYVYYAEGTATPQDTANFEPYSPGNVISVTRSGRFVSVVGLWACKTSGYIATNTLRTFAKLPVGFRPKYGFHDVKQGSGTTSWLLYIKPDGDMTASRSSGSNANYWMPFNITYLAED